MGLSDSAKDILSFGAHGRIQEKQAEFEQELKKLEGAVAARDTRIRDVNEELLGLGRSKRQAVEELKKLKVISKDISARERDTADAAIAQAEAVSVARIEATVTGTEILESSLTGISVGASTALGAWAVTGAGAVALGGVFLLPAVAIMAIFSHAAADGKIEEIEQRIGEIRIALEQLRGSSLALETLHLRIDESMHTLNELQAAYNRCLAGTQRRLYRFGFLSRIIRAVRRFFGGRYFSRRDLLVIQPLLRIAETFAAVIDQKILDERGKVL